MNKTTKTNLICLLIFLCSFMFFGCSANKPKSAPTNTSPSLEGFENKINSDDSLIAYVGTNIFESSLDPIKGAMSHGYSFTNAALLKVSPSSEYVGEMAASWEVSEDALVYTFKLKNDLKFSDGSALKADDVVFTYQTVKARQAENENVDLTRLESVFAADEHTVVFTLSEAYSPFLDTTAKLGIVPRSSYDSLVFDQNPIGSGPWRVIQYDTNQQIILEPNEYYYDGISDINRITLVYMDDSTALSAALSGQLDVVMVSANYADQSVPGMTMKPLETMDIRNISLPVQAEKSVDNVLLGNDVTADIAVREALTIGIDREAIIQNSSNGIGKPAVGFTNNLIWSDGKVFADNRKEEAISILEEAGWLDLDKDGIREKDGLSCEFELYAPEDRYVLAAALAEEAAQLGIKIIPHSSNWDEISDKMHTAAVVWGWGQYSPTVLASLFHSQFAFSPGFDNVAAYQNPLVDTLIEQALNATNAEAAIKEWKEVQKVANADFPYLYLVNIEHCYFINDSLDISLATQIPHPHGHGAPIICNMKDWSFR